jgi:hypothetical protein
MRWRGNLGKRCKVEIVDENQIVFDMETNSVKRIISKRISRHGPMIDDPIFFRDLSFEASRRYSAEDIVLLHLHIKCKQEPISKFPWGANCQVVLEAEGQQ